MTNITVGLFPNVAFNTTLNCMKHGLEREFKMECHDIPRLWPNGAGALLFFLVIYVFQIFISNQISRIGCTYSCHYNERISRWHSIAKRHIHGSTWIDAYWCH